MPNSPNGKRKKFIEPWIRITKKRLYPPNPRSITFESPQKKRNYYADEHLRACEKFDMKINYYEVQDTKSDSGNESENETNFFQQGDYVLYIEDLDVENAPSYDEESIIDEDTTQIKNENIEDQNESRIKIDDSYYVEKMEQDMLSSEDEIQDDDSNTKRGKKKFRLDHEEEWVRKYNALIDYKEKNGNCYVGPKDNPKLAGWCRRQRIQYFRYITPNHKRNSSLTKERIHALNSIGFVWKPKTWMWNFRFNQLKEFKKKHGHTKVSTSKSDLGNWVHIQRKEFRNRQLNKHSYLTDERMEALNSIGFIWKVQTSSWQSKFDELVAFKRLHGHCLVPIKARSPLGNW